MSSIEDGKSCLIHQAILSSLEDVVSVLKSEEDELEVYKPFLNVKVKAVYRKNIIDQAVLDFSCSCLNTTWLCTQKISELVTIRDTLVSLSPSIQLPSLTSCRKVMMKFDLAIEEVSLFFKRALRHAWVWKSVIFHCFLCTPSQVYASLRAAMASIDFFTEGLSIKIQLLSEEIISDNNKIRSLVISRVTDQEKLLVNSCRSLKEIKSSSLSSPKNLNHYLNVFPSSLRDCAEELLLGPRGFLLRSFIDNQFVEDEPLKNTSKYQIVARRNDLNIYNLRLHNISDNIFKNSDINYKEDHLKKYIKNFSYINVDLRREISVAGSYYSEFYSNKFDTTCDYGHSVQDAITKLTENKEPVWCGTLKSDIKIFQEAKTIYNYSCLEKSFYSYFQLLFAKNNLKPPKECCSYYNNYLSERNTEVRNSIRNVDILKKYNLDNSPDNTSYSNSEQYLDNETSNLKQYISEFLCLSLAYRLQKSKTCYHIPTDLLTACIEPTLVEDPQCLPLQVILLFTVLLSFANDVASTAYLDIIIKRKEELPSFFICLLNLVPRLDKSVFLFSPDAPVLRSELYLEFIKGKITQFLDIKDIYPIIKLTQIVNSRNTNSSNTNKTHTKLANNNLSSDNSLVLDDSKPFYEILDINELEIKSEEVLSATYDMPVYKQIKIAESILTKPVTKTAIEKNELFSQNHDTHIRPVINYKNSLSSLSYEAVYSECTIKKLLKIFTGHVDFSRHHILDHFRQESISFIYSGNSATESIYLLLLTMNTESATKWMNSDTICTDLYSAICNRVSPALVALTLCVALVKTEKLNREAFEVIDILFFSSLSSIIPTFPNALFSIVEKDKIVIASLSASLYDDHLLTKCSELDDQIYHLIKSSDRLEPHISQGKLLSIAATFLASLKKSPLDLFTSAIGNVFVESCTNLCKESSTARAYLWSLQKYLFDVANNALKSVCSEFNIPMTETSLTRTNLTISKIDQTLAMLLSNNKTDIITKTGYNQQEIDWVEKIHNLIDVENLFKQSVDKTLKREKFLASLSKTIIGDTKDIIQSRSKSCGQNVKYPENRKLPINLDIYKHRPRWIKTTPWKNAEIDLRGQRRDDFNFKKYIYNTLWDNNKNNMSTMESFPLLLDIPLPAQESLEQFQKICKIIAKLQNQVNNRLNTILKKYYKNEKTDLDDKTDIESEKESPIIGFDISTPRLVQSKSRNFRNNNQSKLENFSDTTEYKNVSLSDSSEIQAINKIKQNIRSTLNQLVNSESIEKNLNKIDDNSNINVANISKNFQEIYNLENKNLLLNDMLEETLITDKKCYNKKNSIPDNISLTLETSLSNNDISLKNEQNSSINIETFISSTILDELPKNIEHNINKITQLNKTINTDIMDITESTDDGVEISKEILQTQNIINKSENSVNLLEYSTFNEISKSNLEFKNRISEYLNSNINTSSYVSDNSEKNIIEITKNKIVEKPLNCFSETDKISNNEKVYKDQPKDNNFKSINSIIECHSYSALTTILSKITNSTTYSGVLETIIKSSKSQLEWMLNSYIYHTDYVQEEIKSTCIDLVTNEKMDNTPISNDMFFSVMNKLLKELEIEEQKEKVLKCNLFISTKKSDFTELVISTAKQCSLIYEQGHLIITSLLKNQELISSYVFRERLESLVKNNTFPNSNIQNLQYEIEEILNPSNINLSSELYLGWSQVKAFSYFIDAIVTVTNRVWNAYILENIQLKKAHDNTCKLWKCILKKKKLQNKLEQIRTKLKDNEKYITDKLKTTN